MGSGWFRLWLRNRWRGIGAGVVLLLALVVVVFVVTNGSGVSLTLLGDAAAARPSAAPGSAGVLPQDGAPHSAPGAAPAAYASVLDRAAPASAGPQSVAEAQAHWSAAEIARHQQEILAAYNCARTQHGLPSATLDAALSETAATAWLRLTHDRSFSLLALPGDYAVRGVLALDFAPPDATAAPAAGPGGTTDAGASGCTVGGFDATTLPMMQRARTVGIAVFPPQAGWNGASAVVLVKE